MGRFVYIAQFDRCRPLSVGRRERGVSRFNNEYLPTTRYIFYSNRVLKCVQHFFKLVVETASPITNSGIVILIIAHVRRRLPIVCHNTKYLLNR